MNKKIGLLLSLGAVALALAGCSRDNLTVGASTKKADGMVAIIKGRVASKAKVSYSIDNAATQSTKNVGGAYTIEIPSTTKEQKVKVTAKNDGSTISKTVTVEKEKRLADFSKFKDSFNQAIVGMNMSKSDQQLAQKLQKEGAELKKQAPADPKKAQAELAAMPAAERVQAMQKMKAMQQQASDLKKQSAQLQSDMDKIKNDKKDQLIPDSPKTGVTEWVNQKEYQIRGNYQNGDMMGLTVIATTKAMKHPSQAKGFGTAFGIAAKEVGANPKDVMNQFKSYSKKAKSGQTTMKTITSNGVKFNIGLSTTRLYIYITK
ncbi:lipoprotein [Pediococcus claussenii]|uniref:Lipoprotein n=1 Tax=Pediococcus claussenii (strain ATCC BAA-344 / DSM 14800 / JCM 18046 / KCTC 3811 / LMG 21948 / P06) TaxID=701521 RepID=G8PBJ5_PEDCP|nr:lipoprotein [Pediococcus claussenii]AEV94744.1 lipoprotein [Pediococcus claussenii ATCC BAA-344]ANZ69940.1 hypothetical protein AYR57_06275 [Pediococcus claussenii]ANZ71756.1 hypothetical protein AYR58_06275 [Pediococcus claussenii]KRN20923.1 hypothetical protein IV79_GL000148 [Pediococcus claussenii]